MRVLIIKLGALGDVVMATPLIAAIQRAHPDAEHWLLTTPAFAPIFAAWPRLQTMAVPRRGLAAMLRSLRWIRQQRFARVYDLQGNDRSGILCALSGIPERVGNHTRYPYTHHPREQWTGQCHIFERMAEVLASAGVGPVAAAPLLPAGVEEEQQVRAWIERHGLAPGGFALLHAGASPQWPTKVWPYFRELAERLETRGIRAVVVGAEPDRERNRVLTAGLGIDATAAFSVPALAALAAHARFAVTNDSGPMHIISAAGIPVFGLFGPSDWRRNHAVGQAARVLACVEFAANFSGARGGDCLAAIPCAAVWAKLEAENLV